MNKKQVAGEKALEWVRDGMTLGLGTGSTVYYTIVGLAGMVKEGLQIEAVATSRDTDKLARDSGIPLTSFAEVAQLDLCIDGADAVTPQLHLIKGGGGALLREKLVAKASDVFIVVADDSKRVNNFNGFPIPIEVVPFAWEVTRERIHRMGGATSLRSKNGQTVITDNGNFILDTVFQTVEDVMELEQGLKLITGVIDTGLFLNMATAVVIGTEVGTTIHQREK